MGHARAGSGLRIHGGAKSIDKGVGSFADREVPAVVDRVERPAEPSAGLLCDPETGDPIAAAPDQCNGHADLPELTPCYTSSGWSGATTPRRTVACPRCEAGGLTPRPVPVEAIREVVTSVDQHPTTTRSSSALVPCRLRCLLWTGLVRNVLADPVVASTALSRPDTDPTEVCE